MFKVYELCDTGLGYDEVLVATFNTEVEAEAFMAELIAEDMENYGELCEEYFIEEA